MNKQNLIMIRNILFIASFFLFNSCKNDSDITEREVYRYDESVLAYSFDIYSKNDLNRIAFLLDKEKKLVTILLYRKDENYKNITIPIDESEVKDFVKIIDKQLSINSIFTNTINNNTNGYEVIFFTDAGGGTISANYPNVLNFSDEISAEFDKLLRSLRKVKEVNYFFEQEIQ